MSERFSKLRNHFVNKKYLQKLAYRLGSRPGTVAVGAGDFFMEKIKDTGEIVGLVFSDSGTYDGYAYLWRENAGVDSFEVTSAPSYIPQVGEVTAENLNMRSGPGTNNAVQRILPGGTRMALFEESRGWYRVGATGWVSGLYVRKTGDNAWPARGEVLTEGLGNNFIKRFFRRLKAGLPNFLNEARIAEQLTWQERLSERGTWSVERDDEPTQSVVSKSILRENSHGAEVIELQRMLINFGYDLGSTGSDGDGVDGDFGGQTKKAVREYQQSLVASGRIPETYTDRRGRARSNVDGVVGDTTWAELYKDFESSQESQQGPEQDFGLVANFSELPGPATSWADLLTRNFSNYVVEVEEAGEEAWGSMAIAVQTSPGKGEMIKPTTKPYYVKLSRRETRVESLLFLIAETPPVETPLSGFQSADSSRYVAYVMPGEDFGALASGGSMTRNAPFSSGGRCDEKESGEIIPNNLICYIMKELKSFEDENMSARERRMVKRRRSRGKRGSVYPNLRELRSVARREK